MNTFWPRHAHVTCVESPRRSSVNSLTLCATNGFRKSTTTTTFEGGTDSVTSIRPDPVLPDPVHSDVAPLPLETEPNVRAALACPSSPGHSGQRRRSLMNGKI